MKNELEKKTEKNEIVTYDLNQLLSVVVTIIILGAVLTFGLDLITEQSSEFESGSSAANASGKVVESVEKVANRLPLVVGAIIMAVIIGILIRYFAFNRMS
jgi:ABC-type phosphate transport system permease subunit